MLFKFNLYSSLLLPAVIQCIIFSLLCLWRFAREKSQRDFFLALLLTVTGIKLSFWMFGFAGWYDSHDGYSSFMFYFPFNAYLLSGPLVYFYFRSLTNRNFKLSRREWPHFVLPVLFALLILVKLAMDFLFYRPFPKTPDFQYGTHGPWAEADKSAIVILTGFICFFFYLWLVLKLFPAYRTYVRDNFSDTDHLDLNWLRGMLFAIAAGVLILFGFKVWELIFGGVSYVSDWFGYLVLAVLSYYIAIKGFYLANTREASQLEFQAVPEPVLTGFDETVWLIKIDEIMANARPFLSPELSLADLAAMLQTNKSIVSKAINSGFHQNFNDFINGLRVNEVISLLKKGKQEHMNLLGIAYDCGFNSKATFNRAFKKKTGLTPKAFISKLEKERE